MSDTTLSLIYAAGIIFVLIVAIIVARREHPDACAVCGSRHGNPHERWCRFAGGLR